MSFNMTSMSNIRDHSSKRWTLILNSNVYIFILGTHHTTINLYDSCFGLFWNGHARSIIQNYKQHCFRRLWQLGNFDFAIVEPSQNTAKLLEIGFPMCVCYGLMFGTSVVWSISTKVVSKSHDTKGGLKFSNLVPSTLVQYRGSFAHNEYDCWLT